MAEYRCEVERGVFSGWAVVVRADNNIVRYAGGTRRKVLAKARADLRAMLAAVEKELEGKDG